MLKLLLSKLLFALFVLWNDWHPHTLGLLEASLESRVVNLLIRWRVVAALSVDIVSQHVLSIVDSADGWLDVTLAVGMESWLSEIGDEGRVRQPASGVVEIRATLMHILLSLPLSWRHVLVSSGSLSGLS